MSRRDWTYLIRALDGTIWVVKRQPEPDHGPMDVLFDPDTGSRAVRKGKWGRQIARTKTAWFREVAA